MLSRKCFARPLSCATLGAFAFLCSHARAEALNANWLPTQAGTYSFTNTVNWDIGRVPTNSTETTYTVNFAPGAIDGEQDIHFPDRNDNLIYLGTVLGASNQTIHLPQRPSNVKSERKLYVTDPNAFRGTWKSEDAHSWFVPQGAGDLTPSFSTIDTTFSPYFIPQPGTPTAIVERLAGGGMIIKGGNDNVTIFKDIELTAQSRTRLRMGYLNSTAVLDVKGPARTLPVTAGICVHFDASRTDTLDIEEGDDGKKYVTAWRDAAGGSVTAKPYAGTGHTGVARAQRPWLTDVPNARQVPLVDFGSFENTSSPDESPHYAERKETAGPSTSMTFKEVSGIREVFLVWQDVHATGSRAFILGAQNSYYFHRGSANTLLDKSYYAVLHNPDHTYIDGHRTVYSHTPYDFTQLTVASINFGVSGNEKACAGTLAQDRRIRFGGIRLAEVIIYTNALTVLERQSVHAYLQNKWSLGQRYVPFTLRDVQVDTDTQPLEVPAERNVDIGALKVAKNKTFVKKGEGSLNVDTVSTGTLKISVEGGRMTFNRTMEKPLDQAPAEAPALWLDASAANTLVFTNLENGVESRTYLHRWNDCRETQTACYALPFSGSDDKGTRPFMATCEKNGRSVVDFGNGDINNPGSVWNQSPTDAARMTIQKAVATYDGFIVLRMKNPDDYYKFTTDGAPRISPPTLFGTSSMAFTRWHPQNAAAPLISNYGLANAQSAYWKIDGVSYVPNLDTFDFGTADFHVVCFSALKPEYVNRLASDRNITFGGLQIAEMILYDRPLSIREQRQTEAYLMKKWLDTESPAARSDITLEAVAFTNGAPAHFESDRTVNIRTLAVPANATLSQNGTGSISVQSPLSPTAHHTFTVDGGSLTLEMADPFSDAYYHFDATDADSIVGEAQTLADGSVVTNVTQWLDTRRNGMVAKKSSQGVCVAAPVYRSVATRPGKTMPVLDFGDVSFKNGICNSDTAGMDIYANNAFPSLAAGSVKEAHVIYCDAHDTYEGYQHRFIFSDSQGYAAHRHETGGLVGAYSTWSGDGHWGYNIRAGTNYLDGAVVDYAYAMTDRQFHLISVVPTNVIPMRTIARDRTARAGGSYQGELITFKEHLTEARRTYIQRYLMWKWLGEGEKPVYTNTAAAIHLANGGTLALNDGAVLSVPVVKGNGTIRAGALTDVAQLAFTFKDGTHHDALTVDGDLSLAPEGTLDVDIAETARTAGVYPLITATGTIAGSLDAWTVTLDNASPFHAALELKGQALNLRLSDKGTLLILR